MIRRLSQQVVRILTLRCDDHRRLQAMRLDGTLSVADRMAMWGHWIACGPCRKIVRQLMHINEKARQLEPDESPKLSDDARERIEASLDGVSKRSPRP